jgi:transposase
MILNALGFLSAPLYLFSEFFESKAVSHLLGEGVEARHLNHDRLGRVLDQLYEAGLTSLFMKVALEAVQRFGINIEQRHLDSTSISVEGEYATARAPKAEGSAAAENGEDRGEEPIPIEICLLHSAKSEAGGDSG